MIKNRVDGEQMGQWDSSCPGLLAPELSQQALLWTEMDPHVACLHWLLSPKAGVSEGARTFS